MSAGKRVANSRVSIIKTKRDGIRIDFALRRRGLTTLIARVTGSAVEAVAVDALLVLFERPNDLLIELRRLIPVTRVGLEVQFVGPLERRVAFLGDTAGCVAVTFGDYGLEVLPKGVAARIADTAPLGAQLWCVIEAGGLLLYLARPTIYLVALYHPEVFPLPRLSLAISDLVRAARSEGVARVVARDMQLGADVAGLARDVAREAPDILGISATFGQHDVLDALLAEIRAVGWPKNCQLAFGGSLCVLNQRVLLENFPAAVVATGPGEKTMADLVRLHRGELALDGVAGIAYRNSVGEIVQTDQVTPREIDDMLPELDLLNDTLTSKGVAQLESSRGCSYACSFCPRLHKGVWAGDDPAAVEAVLPDIVRILDRHPDIARKIFLVDEEFFGYRPDNESERRVEELAVRLANYGLRFETSSRADQVHRRNRDRAWHAARFSVWRRLVGYGLDRCLFGIESGVDSILRRFNKKTSSAQNSVAIRTLSLLGIPPRYTYITFDPLMDRRELEENYSYLARTDLLLPAAPWLDDGTIYDIATSDARACAAATQRPFYQAVSYMLVSIECLLGAPYTQQAMQRGLLRAFNPRMGRYDADYLDPDIGLFSDCGQRWVDRNFALDYLLKSIAKYSRGEVRDQIGAMRTLIKDFAFDLLGLMIGLWDPDAPTLRLAKETKQAMGLYAASARFMHSEPAEKKAVVLTMMDRHFVDMRAAVVTAFDKIGGALPAGERAMIAQRLDTWSSTSGWNQINELVS